jgi:hypothetical protein
MKRKKQETITCPHCGGGVTYMARAMSSPAPLLNYSPPPKDQRTIEAVDIPFKHGLHVSMPVGFVTSILCVLGGVPQSRSIGWGVVVTSIVFVVVRVTASVGDWNQFLWQLERIVAPAPAPATQSPQPSGGYLPVHSPARPHAGRHAVLRNFVRGCAVNTSQNYWEQTRKMGRAQYIELRDLLINLRWAGWVSAKARGQGWKLLYPVDEIIAGLFRGDMKDGEHPAPPKA